MRALRRHLPLFLALSANSPYWRGQDSGMASIRTSLFRMFPRVGIPRAVHRLPRICRCHRRPDPMPGDPRADVPLVGRPAAAAPGHRRGADHGCADLVLADRRARGARPEPRSHGARRTEAQSPRIPRLSSSTRNVFRAARDGLEAELLDPLSERSTPARSYVEALVDRLAGHAEELGCDAELAAVREIVHHGGGARHQRQIVEGHGPDVLLPALAHSFADS